MTTPLKKVPIHLQSAANRLLIKNGQVVNADGGIEKVDVYIEDVKIKQVGNNLVIPGGARVIDARGKFVIPGGIDANVHFQTPYGDTQSIDDFYQGTKAALQDGTTLVIDCIKPSAEETLAEAFTKWRAWGDDRVCCDYALKMQIDRVDEGVKQEMAALANDPQFGVNTFAVSMSGPTALKDCQLLDVFETCSKIGGLAAVHCESGEVVARNEEKMMAKGITGPEGYAAAHSEMAEEEAVMRATTLANQINCPVYISDITSPSSANIIYRKKNRGNVVFGETLASSVGCDGDHYRHKTWSHAAAYVTSPPIRSDGAKEELVAALASDQLDVVASKHCTFNSKQKAMGKRDFRKIPVGVNGVESRMSVLWEKAVHTGKMTPGQFVAVTSANPAKIFNLYPKKGCIAVGSDADVIIWNPETTRYISTANDNLKTDFNVFEGMEIHGIAETVVCNGRIVVDEGLLRAMTGFGNYIPCPPFSPYVFDKVKAKESSNVVRAVERSEEDMMTITAAVNGHNEEVEIPGPPTPPKSNQATPAPSQRESSFDLTSHPNTPGRNAVGQVQNNRPSAVKVRAPPGGKSSGGFW